MKKIFLLFLFLLYPCFVPAQVTLSGVQLSGVVVPSDGIIPGTLPIMWTCCESTTVGVGDEEVIDPETGVRKALGIGYRGYLQGAEYLGKSFQWVGDWGTIPGDTPPAQAQPVRIPKSDLPFLPGLQLRNGGWGGCITIEMEDYIDTNNVITRWIPKPVHPNTTVIYQTGNNDITWAAFQANIIWAPDNSTEALRLTREQIPLTLTMVQDRINALYAYSPLIHMVVFNTIFINDTHGAPIPAWREMAKQVTAELAAEFTALWETMLTANPDLKLYPLNTHDLIAAYGGSIQVDNLHLSTEGYKLLTGWIFDVMPSYDD